MPSSKGTPKPEKWVLDWGEFEMRTQALIGEIRQRAPASAVPMAVLALGRGASPLASVLANVFGVKMYYLGLSSYKDDDTQGHLQVFQELTPTLRKHLQVWGRNLLVVDDIWDTGRTFAHARGVFPLARFASLIVKDLEGQEKLDPNLVWASEVGPNVWVEFPWEKNYG